MRKAALYAASGGFLTLAFGVLGGGDAEAAPKPPATGAKVVKAKAVKKAPKAVVKKAAARKPVTKRPVAKKTVAKKVVATPKRAAKPKPVVGARKAVKPKAAINPKSARKSRTITKPKSAVKGVVRPAGAAVAKRGAVTGASFTPAKRAVGKAPVVKGRKGTTKPVLSKASSPTGASKPLPQSLRLAEAGAERQAKTEDQFARQRRDNADLKRTAPARAAYAESQRGGAPGTAQRKRAERTLRMLEQTAPARTAYANSQRGGAPGSGLARQIADARDRAAKLGAVRDAGQAGSVRAYELSEQRAKSASDEVVRLEKQKVDRDQSQTQRRNEKLARAAQAQVDYNDSQAGRPVGERTGLVVESVAPAVSRVTNPKTGEVRLNDYRIDRDAPPQEKLIPLLSEKAQEAAKRFPIDEYNAAPPGYLITSTAHSLVEVCQEADFECGDDFATGLVATLISNGQQPANTAEAGDQLLAGVLASSVGGRPGLGGGAPRGRAVLPVRPPTNRDVAPKTTAPPPQVTPKATASAPQAWQPRVPVTAGAPAPRVLVPSKPAKSTDPVRKPEPIRVRPLPDKTPVPEGRPVGGTPDRPKPPPRPDPDRPDPGGKTGRSTKSGAPGTPVQPRQPRDPDWNKPAREPRGVPTSPRAPERPGAKPEKPGAAKPDVNDPATPRTLPDPAAPRTLPDPEQPRPPRQVPDTLRANGDDRRTGPKREKVKSDNGKSDGERDENAKDKRKGRAGRVGKTSAELGLPSDALVWRWRDIPRIKEADRVRQAIRDRLQQAANEAEKQFRARPDAEDQRYTGGRAAIVRKARDEAQAATDRKNKEEALVREGRGSEAELKRLRDEAKRLWRAHGIAKKREAGNEIDAIWKNMILEQQAEILGEHASDYRLRPSAYFNVNGGGTGKDRQKPTIPDLVLERITPDGKTQYVAHVYDLKTGKKGIEEPWRFRTERNARGLFTIEEIRPK